MTTATNGLETLHGRLDERGSRAPAALRRAGSELARLTIARDARIRHAHDIDGFGIDEIAVAAGMSRRNVIRVLAGVETSLEVIRTSVDGSTSLHRVVGQLASRSAFRLVDADGVVVASQLNTSPVHRPVDEIYDIAATDIGLQTFDL